MVTNSDEIWKKFYDERGSSILIDKQHTLTHIVNQGYESIRVIKKADSIEIVLLANEIVLEILSKHYSRILLTVH